MDSQEKDPPVAVNCILKVAHTRNDRALLDSSRNHQWDLPHPPIGPQKQSLTLRYIKGKTDKDYIPVVDATVYISYVSESSQREEILPFSYVEDGRWESDSPIEIQYNTDYTLSVDIPGREPIRARTTSPPNVGMINALGSEEDPKVAYSVFVSPYEKGAVVRDYAAWIYAQEYSAEGWVDLDYIATDNPYADDFNISQHKFSDLNMSGELMDQEDYHVQIRYGELQAFWPEASLHEKFVRIYNLEYMGHFFLYGGPKWYLNLESTDYFGRGWSIGHQTVEYNRYLCHILSKDLDVYLRNIYIHEHSLDSYLTSVYSNPNQYSNINGGMGIFGCDCLFYFDYMY